MVDHRAMLLDEALHQRSGADDGLLDRRAVGGELGGRGHHDETQPMWMLRGIDVCPRHRERVEVGPIVDGGRRVIVIDDIPYPATLRDHGVIATHLSRSPADMS